MKRVARFEKRPRDGAILVDWEDLPDGHVDRHVAGLLGGEPDYGPVAVGCDAGEAIVYARGPVMVQVIPVVDGIDPGRAVGKAVDGLTLRMRTAEDGN